MQVRTLLKLALAAGLFALGTQIWQLRRPPTNPSSCRACAAARR
jgi:hypothetical protein